jgi:type 2 lantibiotic biosynthesis protein LanM
LLSPHFPRGAPKIPGFSIDFMIESTSVARSSPREPSPAAGAEGMEPRLQHLAAGAERLGERLARTAGAPGSDPPPADLLDRWARAFSRGDRAALARRLAWDGLTPDRAAAALAPEAPPETLPAWLVEVTGWGVLGSDLRGRSRRAEVADLPFGELWAPWLEVAHVRLAGALPAAAEIPPESRAELLRGLAEELSRVSALAAHEAFQTAREEDPRPGAHRRFVDRQLQLGLEPLYAAYPVLLRQTHRLVTTWGDALAELLERLERDREALAARFAGGRPLGGLTLLRRLPSDRHAGGRGVFLLGFESGAELVYKPRDLTVEATLAAVCSRLAGLGLSDPPAALEVLVRPGYGWMERALQADLESLAAVPSYLRRSGALIAVAELLGGQDLHAENIVATRRGPVVVDAEMLLQPERAGADTSREASFAAGLLPRPGARDREAAWAGLLPVPARPLAGSTRVWREVGTDAIAPAAEPAVARPLPNVPALEGAPVAPWQDPEAVLEGHAAAWRALLTDRRALAAPDGPLAAAAGARVRLLFRPSQDYASVLDLLARPRYQRDAAAAGLLLGGLLRPFAEHRDRPLLWPLVAEERGSLEDLDVPRFEVGADAVEVGSAAAPIAGLLARSGLAAVRARLERLDEAGIARRRGEIADALAAAGPAGAPAPVAGAARRRPADRVALIHDLADRLAAHCAAEPRVDPALGVADRLEAVVLYDGRAGVLVALAEADRLVGGRRAEGAAAAWLADVATLLADLDRDPALDLPVGVLNGLGSLVWASVALAEGSPLRRELLAAATEAARRISPSRLAADRRLDVEGGAAGAALALLAAAEATGGADLLTAARAARDRLLETAQPPDAEDPGAWRGGGGPALAGFAHGASGIARALAALARATSDARYLDAARAGLAWERRIFDAGRGNWPVRVVDPRLGETRATWMVAWCHGAPGVALARAAAPKAAGREGAGELEIAVATTIAAGAASHDHLCCGTAGRLAVLDSLARQTGRGDWRAAAEALAAGLSGRPALVGGDPWALPAGSRTARRGLFRGTAGILWSLARAAGEAAGPDLVRFETPWETVRRRPEKR